MKYNLVLLVAATLAFTACGTKNPADPVVAKAPATETKPADKKADAAPAVLEVLGSWHAPSVDEDGKKAESTITITDKSVTVKNSCSYKGKPVEGEQTAAAVVDATTIDIQADLLMPLVINADDKTSFSCDINIAKAKITYLVRDGKLYFKSGDQETLVGDRKIVAETEVKTDAKTDAKADAKTDVTPSAATETK